MWRSILVTLFCALELSAQTTNVAAPAKGQALLLSVENHAEVLRYPATNWDAANTNAPYNILRPGDQLSTGTNSRAVIQFYGEGPSLVGELTKIRLPLESDEKSVLEIFFGKLFNFHRGPPGEMRFKTPTVSAIVRGTEFMLQADQDATSITVFNGEVDMTNGLGHLSLTSGQSGLARRGTAPAATAVLATVDLIQWCMYYPGVVCLDELAPGGLGADLQTSLQAYRNGDLIEALNLWPPQRVPVSDQERVYRAALLLSVGNVDGARDLLGGLNPGAPAPEKVVAPGRLGRALERFVALVKSPGAAEPAGADTNHFCATEWLVESYYLQAQFRLEEARKTARQAVERAPNFAFGWERLAELEFGFGRVKQSQEALARSLELAPRNAQAVALGGFLLAAQNRVRPAMAEFDRAITLDGSLGNAWLGRGLCWFRLGRVSQALDDLEVAAAVEPQRAMFRSYLGKAFSQAGQDQKATQELKLAREFDPRDPTAWLYAALLEQQENQINPAIADLQTAQADNTNRSVFRSRLLLDKDRAVTGANLASVYRDAGMTDVSVREAARAVTDDYANDSAHLFLADSYYALLDPTQFNLRYDTVWFNELLLANILAPVGGGRLSQQVSQQDYSKLFERDGLGLANSTDLRTDGMTHQTTSQFGAFGNTAYGLDLDYYHNDGVRINNTLDNLNLDATLKRQIGPHDTGLLLIQYENYHSGDNFQYYYQSNAMPYYKFAEQQQPELVGAWHHEWSPGIHTLLLLGRLVDDQQFSDQSVPEVLLYENSKEATQFFNAGYQEQFEIYSAELQQICQWDRVTWVAGGRYQSGEFHTQDQFGTPSIPGSTGYSTSTASLFQRMTGYSYLTVEVLKHLWLTGGLAADDEKFPYYFRNPPVTSGEDTRSQLGPKAALVWSPVPEATVRGIYTRSLGGASIDESYRLEPTELAGFPQAFRSLISESIVGSQSAPTFDTLGCALDLKMGTRTYLGFQIERLSSDVNQGQGDFFEAGGTSPETISGTPLQLNYVEHDGSVSLNQLLGEGFVLGAAYKITQSDLHLAYPDIPVSVATPDNPRQRAALQEAGTYLLFNHPSGFYAKVEAQWYGQDNAGYTPAEPAVSFFQENIYAGYRFLHRRAEMQFGILNLSGGGYDLNPLTVYQELPRKRVFEARFNFIF
jgi:tetratricopeptide (TPR) repeat protein